MFSFAGRRAVGLLASLLVVLPASAQHPKLNAFDYLIAHDMLREAYDDVKKNYYDPQYHGIDLDARYHQFETRLASVSSLNAAMLDVQAFLDGLKDSHTFFVPPPRPFSFETGFRMQIIGDRCYIVRVRPGTDAAGKLHPGDRVVRFNSYSLNREDFGSAVQYFTEINPTLIAELDLQAPDGSLRHESVKATSVRGKSSIDSHADMINLVRERENEDHVYRSTVIQLGSTCYWKLPQFDFSMDLIDNDVARAGKCSALVLDLRGNPGGSIDTLQAMLAGVFDHDVKVGDRVGRKESKPFIAKRPIGARVFAGKLIVLVDSKSASASELFARMVQLEHRGTVIGDKTAGAVMEARDFEGTSGRENQVPFWFSVTDADIVMSDGKSLEKLGVTPDEIIVPTAQDLAAGRDPVMARGAGLAGATLSPEDAGSLFPIEWLPLLPLAH